MRLFDKALLLLLLFPTITHAWTASIPIEYRGYTGEIAGVAITIKHPGAEAIAVRSHFSNIQWHSEDGKTMIAAAGGSADTHQIFSITFKTDSGFGFSLGRSVIANTEAGYPASGMKIPAVYNFDGKKIPVRFEGRYIVPKITDRPKPLRVWEIYH